MTFLRPSSYAGSLALILALAFSVAALAQQAPDAGQTLQQLRQAPQPPRLGQTIALPSATAAPAVPGGEQLTVQTVSFSGNTVFTEVELLAALGDYAGKPYDLAGLRGLADRISSYYRNAGFPFARAFLPQQTASDGRLRIEVVEGRYGKVMAVGDTNLAAPATGFLSPLKPGRVIDSASLERVTLILDDQPGIKSTPVIRPGEAPGSGDLEVRVEQTSVLSGELAYDNYGNRYYGEHRLRANLQWDSPFSFGDQITMRGLYSDEAMWLGNLVYSLPLGSSGLRGNIGYAHTYYALGKTFANLGASGTARVTNLGITYPFIRSQKVNLNLAVTYQRKALNDKKQAANTEDDKSSESLPLALNFDLRDSLWSGGITYGSLAYTAGRLKLGSMLESTDRTSGMNTRGSFDKWNLDIVREQATPVAGLTLLGRISSQRAGKNLDSSESFILGGATGVRAYPSGEGNGDEGWLVQVEARYTIGSFSPYLFHDSGRVTLNAKNGNLTTPSSLNRRWLGGEGVGVRYAAGPWSVDASLAWRNRGGLPLSDTVDRNPRLWLTAAYRF